MGNKNLILVVCVLLLYFLMIRPLSKKKESDEKSESVKPDSGELTPASSSNIPTFETGLTRLYTS